MAEKDLSDTAAAQPLDVAALGRAMRRRNAAVTAVREKRTRRLLHALAVLTPADRAVLIKLVGTGITQQGSGGPPGGPPPFGAGGPPGCSPAAPR